MELAVSTMRGVHGKNNNGDMARCGKDIKFSAAVSKLTLVKKLFRMFMYLRKFNDFNVRYVEDLVIFNYANTFFLNNTFSKYIKKQKIL